MAGAHDDYLPECLDCGVCCFSELDTYLRVWGSDYERLGERAASLTQFIGNRCYMRIVAGHCAALEPDLDTGRFVCTVYPTRPRICRELERGTAQCAGERCTKGERAKRFIHLARLARRAGRQPDAAEPPALPP